MVGRLAETLRLTGHARQCLPWARLGQCYFSRRRTETVDMPKRVTRVTCSQHDYSKHVAFPILALDNIICYFYQRLSANVDIINVSSSVTREWMSSSDAHQLQGEGEMQFSHYIDNDLMPLVFFTNTLYLYVQVSQCCEFQSCTCI